MKITEIPTYEQLIPSLPEHIQAMEGEIERNKDNVYVKVVNEKLVLFWAFEFDKAIDEGYSDKEYGDTKYAEYYFELD